MKTYMTLVCGFLNVRYAPICGVAWLFPETVSTSRQNGFDCCSATTVPYLAPLDPELSGQRLRALDQSLCCTSCTNLSLGRGALGRGFYASWRAGIQVKSRLMAGRTETLWNMIPEYSRHFHKAPAADDFVPLSFGSVAFLFWSISFGFLNSHLLVLIVLNCTMYSCCTSTSTSYNHLTIILQSMQFLSMLSGLAEHIFGLVVTLRSAFRSRQLPLQWHICLAAGRNLGREIGLSENR